MNGEIITTKVIYADIDDVSNFTFNIDIPHHVDDIIVKTVVFSNGSAPTDYIVIARSDLIDNNILMSFIDCKCLLETMNNVFRVNKKVSGQYNFSLYKIDGTEFKGSLNEISFVIAFIKHE